MDLITVGKKILKRLIENDYEAYFVGGMVRDSLLDREIYDVDIATSAKPDEVMKLFKKTIGTGLKHGTVTVIEEGIAVEITTFRIESNYQDHRRPSDVMFTSSLVEDLKRRDFTINAIAQSVDGSLYDPFQGLLDLKNNKIRAVGNPIERFKEDPLRMLRGLRFVSKLGFELEPETYEAIVVQAELIQHISKERIKKEVEDLIQGEQSEKGLELLIKSGLIQYIDYCQVLKIYQDYPLKLINSSLEYFALVGILNGDQAESYLDAWPFSREEKRLIKAVKYCYQNNLPLPYVQYQYGEQVARAFHQLGCFLNKKAVSFISAELAIQNRKELAIDVKELLKGVKRPKGPWIQDLIERLEYEVIMGRLENKQQVLVDYIKTNHLGELYEFKK